MPLVHSKRQCILEGRTWAPSTHVILQLLSEFYTISDGRYGILISHQSWEDSRPPTCYAVPLIKQFTQRHSVTSQEILTLHIRFQVKVQKLCWHHDFFLFLCLCYVPAVSYVMCLCNCFHIFTAEHECKYSFKEIKPRVSRL